MIKKLKNFFAMFFTPEVKNLSGNDFRQTYESTPDAILLDVRTPGEFDAGHIPGAINIDIMSPYFADRVAELDKSKTVFVYCRSGNRSTHACAMMNRSGFKTYNLEGGIFDYPM